MSYQNGPRIVTNGLVLCLDAGNSKSYSGSGTTWTDLSGNNNNGTLTNGPTFNSANRGSIVFDGSNDYISTNYVISNIFTISGFFKKTNNTSFWAPLWSSEVWNDSSGYLAYFTTSTSLTFTKGGGVGGLTVTSPYDIRNINFYTFIRDSSNNGYIYINGNLIGSGTVTAPSTITANLFLAARHSNDGTSISDAKGWSIYNFHYYNRALSSTEVLQNYNATKGRFGL